MNTNTDKIRDCPALRMAEVRDPEGSTCPLCWEYHSDREICPEVAKWTNSRLPEHELIRSELEAWLVWHFERAGLTCRRSALGSCPGGWRHHLIEACLHNPEDRSLTAVLSFGIGTEGGSKWHQRAPTALRVHNRSGIAIVRDEDGHECINRADIMELRGSGIRDAALRCFRRLVLSQWDTGFSYDRSGLYRNPGVMAKFAEAGGDDLRWLVERAEAQLRAGVSQSV